MVEAATYVAAVNIVYNVAVTTVAREFPWDPFGQIQLENWGSTKDGGWEDIFQRLVSLSFIV